MLFRSLNHGHTVRAMVRDPGRVMAAFSPLGIDQDAVEVVRGDVLEPETVAAALDGCQAAVHAGSVYTLDPQRHDDIRRTNVAGTEIVLRLASERGLDPIIHVSSTVAYSGERGTVITPETAPNWPDGVYARSKADSDRLARSFKNVARR